MGHTSSPEDGSMIFSLRVCWRRESRMQKRWGRSHSSSKKVGCVCVRQRFVDECPQPSKRLSAVQHTFFPRTHTHTTLDA